MPDKIQLTEQELKDLVSGYLDDHFEEIFNDIPMYHEDHVIEKGETHRDYIEDDGRERRWYIFKDLKTGKEHCINYTYNPEWPNDVDVPDFVEIVEESVINPKPEPVPEPEPVLSPEQQADKALMARYHAIVHECITVKPKERLKVPKSTIDDILLFLKTPPYSIYDARAKIIPVCIEYKMEESSFWQWLQVKRGVWKL